MNIKEQINILKTEKKAIVLAHYYQNSDVQEASDFVGDSFALSKMAKETDAEIIVFCGVHFMAETAKILSPTKKVLIANPEAGCYLADCITYESLKRRLDEQDNTKVIAYVNTSAKVKALADVCVTSSNAAKIIAHYKKEYPNDKILYVPDVNLASYVEFTNNCEIEKWPGYCDIHNALTVEEVLLMRKKHPQALLYTHPEAPLEILKISDFVGSTSDILANVKKSSHHTFIIGTEKGILYQLEKDNPTKKFYVLSPKLECKTMKMTTIMDLYQTLLHEKNEIILDEKTIEQAKSSLTKMLELGSM